MRNFVCLFLILLGTFYSFEGNSQVYWNSIYSAEYSNFHPQGLTKDINGNLFMACSIFDDNQSAFIHKILISTDTGLTWNEINTSGISLICSITNIEYINGALFISTINPGVLPYEISIYKSSDNGQTWLTSMLGYDVSYAATDIFAHGTDLFVIGNRFDALTDHKLFKSSDNGQNWNEIANQNLPDNEVQLHSLTYSGNNMILGVKPYNSNFTNTTGGKIFISSDEGLNWIESSSGYDTSFIPTSMLTVLNGDIYISCVKLISSQVGWTSKLFKSTNQGLNWVEFNTAGMNDLSYAVDLIFSDGYFFHAGRPSSGTYGLLFRSLETGLGIQENVNDFESEIKQTYDLTGRECKVAPEFMYINQYANGRNALVFNSAY